MFKYRFILLVYQAVIEPLAWINKLIKRRKKYTDDILLLFINGNLGDFVVCAGAIERLTKLNPDRKISLLCLENIKPIAEELGIIDKIYVIKTTSLKEYLSVVLNIKAKDAVLVPPYWRDRSFSECTMALVAADRKIAAQSNAAYCRRLRKVFDKKYTDLIKFDSNKNFMERMDELFSKMTGESMEPYLYSVKESVEIRPDYHQFFVVNLGASVQAKCWPVERYAKTIEYICSRTTLIPYFIGGKMEAKLVEKLKNYYPGDSQNYCDKTSIHQLFNLIGNAAFYFGNDTGTTHIAAATGIPNYSLTSLAYPTVCLPYPDYYKGKADSVPVVIQTLHDKQCKCCGEIIPAIYTPSCTECIKENGCMECLYDITVEQVIDILERTGILEKYKR